MASKLLQIRVDENIKNASEEIFNSLGLTLTEAIRLFLKRAVIEQGLPFEMKLSITDLNLPQKLEENNQSSFDALSYIYSSGGEK